MSTPGTRGFRDRSIGTTEVGSSGVVTITTVPKQEAQLNYSAYAGDTFDSSVGVMYGFE